MRHAILDLVCGDSDVEADDDDADATQEAKDNLVKWLQEIMAEHGCDDEAVARMVAAARGFLDKDCDDADKFLEGGPIDKRMVRLGIIDKEAGARRFVLHHDATHESWLGVIDTLSWNRGPNLRATCSSHPNCKCHCTPRDGWTQEQLAIALIKWLHTADSSTAIEDDATSVELRKRCGHAGAKSKS